MAQRRKPLTQKTLLTMLARARKEDLLVVKRTTKQAQKVLKGAQQKSVRRVKKPL